jgi:hypothetical protein
MGSRRQGIGSASTCRSEEQGAVLRDAGPVSVEEVDIGLAVDRDLTADPIVRPVIPRFDGNVPPRVGIGQEDPKAAPDLDTLNGRTPTFVVEFCPCTDSKRSLVLRFP